MMIIYYQAFIIRLLVVALPCLTCLCLGPIMFSITNLVSLDAEKGVSDIFWLIMCFS